MPLRGIRQIRDRSENRMRFSERSSIFFPIFPPTPGPLRFQGNLRGRPFLRFLVLFSERKKANFFLFLVLFLSEKGRVFPELRRSRGKYRKRKKYRNRKERQDFIPSAPQGQRKKKRESGKIRPFSFRKRTGKKKSWICLCPFGALDK